ncbi:hypothetical protein QPK87_19330 [Kamptonema cortianum]|nr:hypothetical protein [Geitlerinema splendidum]MDK3158709.1 hypothetical protein [Kamptonema cortianum]
MSVGVREHLVSTASPYQQIDVYDTFELGKMLFLDGHVQLSTRDEYAYHECLVHIPLLALRDPKIALVVGGGDGGILRELVKHPELDRIDMVEIDDLVIGECRRHLPELSDGAFDDPRVKLTIEDAFGFVKNANSVYDLVVLDVTDVYEDEEGELSEKLFTKEFYDDVAKILSPNGMVVTQADNLVFCPYSLQDIKASFAESFPKVGSFWGLVPSFGGFSGFAWASLGADIPQFWPGSRAQDLRLRYLNELTYRLAISPAPFTSPGS